jgi:hypothetical protein
MNRRESLVSAEISVLSLFLRGRQHADLSEISIQREAQAAKNVEKKHFKPACFRFS